MLTDEQQTKLDRIRRVCRVVFGDDYDTRGELVTDYGVGIVDYGELDQVWVLGNWNNPTKYNPETRTHTVLDTTPQRVGNLFDKLGVDCLWLDEWYRCEDCYRVFRAQPDSYGWTMRGLVTPDGECVCDLCLSWDDIEPLAVNNPEFAVLPTWDVNLEDLGFTQHNGWFETGFHPGQTDNPKDVFDTLSGDFDEIVFAIVGVGQFDTRWTVWTRYPYDDTRCVVCGDVVDYCLGHGEIGDPIGFTVLLEHDNDNHTNCHPDGCDSYGVHKSNLDRLRAANTRAGQHWFTPDTMQFFNSRVEFGPTDNGLFVSSEQFDDNTPRGFTVRHGDFMTGEITDVSEFQEFDTLSDAVWVVRRVDGV